MDMIANIFLFLNDGRSTYCAYLIMSKSYHISQGGFKAVQDEAPGYSRIVIIFNYVIFRSGCRFCGTILQVRRPVRLQPSVSRQQVLSY